MSRWGEHYLTEDSPPTTLLQLAQRMARTYPQRGYHFCLGATTVTDSASYSQLDVRARQIAAELAQAGVAPGARALLVYPPGLEFVRAFWGCLYAGVVAVPAVPPHPLRPQRTLPRLLAIANDCQPSLVMTHSEVDGLPPDLGPEHFRTDLCQTPAEGWRPPIRGGVDIAMLQYTSGSTRQPRGVILTHANLLHNLGMLAEFHRHQTDMVMVHWLPLFHDMGLIRGMLSPLHMGGSCFMLDPMEFAQKPIRWLKALSRFSATVTGAPDFGYALTAHKVPAHQLEGLDLSSLKVAFCSAEPIRNASLQRFANLLASVGLSRQALKPAYGLAEATVMVSGEMGEQFRTRAVSRHALGQGRVAPPKDRTDSLDMVNCGAPLGQQQLLIVDSEGRPCPFEVVGEVWIRGGSVSPGYWNNESDTAATFGAYLASGVGPYLRTGDLGWLESDGSLTVCGRLKDLLIIRGQNFYPHDIEAAVEGAVPELRAGCSAAFATEQEDPVVVCEAVEPSDALAYAVWAAAGQEFGLSLREVVILPPGSLPKTASGKVQRGLIRDRHAKGELGASLHWKAPVRPR